MNSQSSNKHSQPGGVSGTTISVDGARSLDHTISQTLKFGAISAVPLLILLVVGGTRRGISSEGLGSRGLIAFALLYLPYLLWLGYLLGLRHLAKVEIGGTGAELNVTRWFGGRTTVRPRSAIVNPTGLTVLGDDGRSFDFSNHHWGDDRIRALLAEIGVDDIRAEDQATKSNTLRERYPMLTGIVSTLGILFGFFAFVFIIVNVAARM